MKRKNLWSKTKKTQKRHPLWIGNVTEKVLFHFETDWLLCKWDLFYFIFIFFFFFIHFVFFWTRLIESKPCLHQACCRHTCNKLRLFVHFVFVQITKIKTKLGHFVVWWWFSFSSLCALHIVMPASVVWSTTHQFNRIYLYFILEKQQKKTLEKIFDEEKSEYIQLVKRNELWLHFTTRADLLHIFMR